MFFKKLEIFGFKSFVEKTKLDFEAGVTAIVGPNGCGKSNLADAIKWVLGEQSVRSMRGVNMEDVIFHGADNIQPVGFAEVSLTISNQDKLLQLDYSEITITRRIFRSGESEYLLNKIPVRLKDISELLMDTGLGMRSYSLMEQGKVDQILNSRPEDRRAIFEEASGITKYKSKKEEALRKLERTQENLQRIGDIIVEVKRQIKSIERQVNKARRYKDEFERLKEYELKVSQYQYQDLKKQKRDLDNRSSQLGKEESSLIAQMNSLNDTLRRKRQDLSSAEENFSSVQAENYEVCATMEMAQNKISLDKERIEELIRRQEDLGQQIEDLERKATQTSEQIEDAHGKIEEIEQEKQKKSTSLTEKETNIDNICAFVQEVQEKITKDKAQEVELIAQQARLRNDLIKLEADLVNFNARLRRLNVESERTQQEINGIEEKYQVCAQEAESLSVQLKTLTREIWDLKSSLDIKFEKKHTLDSRIENIAHQITSLQSKLNFLKEISKKNEGFSRGVKAILSAAANQAVQLAGQCRVVADLIEVLPQYQPAIEMALGESAQAVVVENSQAAFDAIHYLKEKDLGQASFICLDSLKPDKNLESLPGTLGWALEFVKTESKYQKVLEYLLVNTFIVQDLETARRVVQQIEPGSKLVTLNGEVLTAGTISGGSESDNPDLSLLGRRERIAATSIQLEQLIQERQELEGLKIEQQAAIEEVSGLIQQKEPDLNKLKIKSANKESEKANIEADKKRFQDEIAVLQVEIDETEEQARQLKADQEKLQHQLKDLEANQQELKSGIQDDQGSITQKNQEKQNLLVEIAEIKTQLSALDRDTENAQARLQMILDSQTEQARLKQARAREVEDTASKVEQLKQEIIQLESQTKDLTQAKVNIGERMNQTQQLRRELVATIADIEDKARTNQQELDRLREGRNKLQIKLTEFSYKQDALKERMQQSYQVDLGACLEDTLEISPPEESVFDEINQLKTKLEGMGPINMVAIEENDQLQQRYSFLVSQQEDLSRAQDSLRKAIVQINRTARTMFAETFQKIEVSFREYFRILFGGGDARIILLDENNVLESGIEIVVRPPGKRLQNISLLSGGEKALTAIALLFAIFKVKPSPFCILDEVDAPLDEANVDRFTNLLSEFIKTSQFIIITHNKKTINMADIMYGITMEKSGVSQIVSVRLTDEKDIRPREEVPQLS